MGPSIVYTNSSAFNPSTANANNIYLLRDTKKMYLGSTLFSDETVEFLQEKPETLVKGRLYFIDTPADPSNGVEGSKSFITFDGTKEVDLLKIIGDAALAEIDWSPYVTNDSLATTLQDYVQTTDLQNTLTNYSTSNEIADTYLAKTDAASTYATKDELQHLAQITDGAFHFRGKLNTIEDLPGDANEGDVYQVGNHEYAMNTDGEWVDLGDLIDLSDYSTTEEMNNAIAEAIAENLAIYETKEEAAVTVQDSIDASAPVIIEQASDQAFYDIYAQLKAKGYKGTRNTFLAQLAEVLNNTDAIVINEGQSTTPALAGSDVESLAEALNALSANANTSFVSNATLDGAVTIGDATIDMNDKMLEVDNKRTTVTGNLTINNGNIVDNSDAAVNAISTMFALEEGSSLTIKDTEIDTTTAQVINGTGNVVLEGVNINSSLAADKAATSYDSKTLIDVTKGTVTMKDGSIIADTSSDTTCGLYGICATGGSTITLGDQSTGEGPTIITNSAPIGTNNLDGGIDNITIYGGYYKSLMTHPQFEGVMYLGASANVEIFGGEFWGGDYDIALPYRPAKYTVKIHGGTFNGANMTINKDYKNGGKGPDTDNDQDSIIIDGGRFKCEVPAAYLAAGYTQAKEGDYWVVKAAE